MNESKELKTYQVVVTVVTSNSSIDVDMIDSIWKLLDQSKGEMLKSVSIPKEV